MYFIRNLFSWIALINSQGITKSKKGDKEVWEGNSQLIHQIMYILLYLIALNPTFEVLWFYPFGNSVFWDTFNPVSYPQLPVSLLSICYFSPTYLFLMIISLFLFWYKGSNVTLTPSTFEKKCHQKLPLKLSFNVTLGITRKEGSHQSAYKIQKYENKIEYKLLSF